jgi:hypothetical protein
MMAVLQPIFCHVFPLSSDFKIPIPAYEEREEFTSPVPTQIVPFPVYCDILYRRGIHNS